MKRNKQKIPKVNLLHLPVDLWHDLKILAAKQDTTLQALGVQALEGLLAAHGER